jgi:hypothetical protein
MIPAEVELVFADRDRQWANGAIFRTNCENLVLQTTISDYYEKHWPGTIPCLKQSRNRTRDDELPTRGNSYTRYKSALTLSDPNHLA